MQEWLSVTKRYAQLQSVLQIRTGVVNGDCAGGARLHGQCTHRRGSHISARSHMTRRQLVLCACRWRGIGHLPIESPRSQALGHLEDRDVK